MSKKELQFWTHQSQSNCNQVKNGPYSGHISIFTLYLTTADRKQEPPNNLHCVDPTDVKNCMKSQTYSSNHLCFWPFSFYMDSFNIPTLLHPSFFSHHSLSLSPSAFCLVFLHLLLSPSSFSLTFFFLPHPFLSLSPSSFSPIVLFLSQLPSPSSFSLTLFFLSHTVAVKWQRSQSKRHSNCSTSDGFTSHTKW